MHQGEREGDVQTVKGTDWKPPLGTNWGEILIGFSLWNHIPLTPFFSICH